MALANISKEKLQEACDRSKTYRDIFDFLGISCSGQQQKRLKSLIKYFKIDFHSKPGLAVKGNIKYKTVDELLNSNKSSRYRIKMRLTKEGLLSNHCSECKIKPEWNGKALSLQLDHINGINNDNRLENLRLLCPNCHSQTDNFSGKSLKKEDNKCPDCSKVINRKSKRCYHCAAKLTPQATKVILPLDELQDLVSKYPMQKVAKHFGVSDKIIKARCVEHNIPVHTRGYWQKIQSEKFGS